MNNIGNSEQLGKAVMADTDWNVGADKIVETIDESLIYLSTTKDLYATPILDQRGLETGVTVLEKKAE
jgi:hypothetical protein